MANHYVMTPWGPMRTVKQGTTGSSSLTAGAPESMNTFLEVYNKYKELEDRLNAMGVSSVGNWLTKEVKTLPTAGESTTNTIYRTSSGQSYVTVNKGTDASPKYEWAPLGNTQESDPIWESEKSNYQLKIQNLDQIIANAEKGATAVQPVQGKGLFSGSYNDLTDKPTIPSLETLEKRLEVLENLLKGTSDTTEDIDTLPEVISFLQNYKNNQTLEELNSFQIEDISEEQFEDVF